MSGVLPSTLLQQQSFNPDWVISDSTVPTGIVISCQFTTTDNSAIYLRSMSVKDQTLTIVFSQGDADGVCAYISTQTSGSVLPMVVSGSVLSATVEIGVIPSKDFMANFTDALVNDAYINVVNIAQPRQNTVTIVQDGLSSEHVLDSDLSITVGDKLTGEFDAETGELTISMASEDYLDFTQLGDAIIFPDTEISAINGVKAKDGVISVNIYNDGALVPVIQKAPNWVELDNSPNISFCPNFVDTLDSHIAPTTHIGYYPLDDAYTDKGRDTSVLLNNEYGGFGIGESTKLLEVDENVDVKESE